MSVPRREEMAKEGVSNWRHQRERLVVGAAWTVSPGTAPFKVFEERIELQGSFQKLSTSVRSASRNPSSRRCVNCVPSAVALRKRTPELRTEVLRTPVLRSLVLRTEKLPTQLRPSVPRSVASAYPPASSPKSTLAGVFERMKRAARAKKVSRISERLAPQFKSSAPQAEAVRWLAAKCKRVRESEKTIEGSESE